MAVSDASICNIALQRIGVTSTIDLLTQRTKEAIVCNTVYSNVREKTLVDAPFPFSRKYSMLNLSGTPALKWKYRYVYPNDCLAIRNIFPNIGEGYDPIAFRRVGMTINLPYEIAIDDTGEKTILTDIESAVIEYTCNITNPARFDAKFVSLFAWGLAAEIALPLARDIKFSQQAFSMYAMELNQALATALNEETVDEQPDSEFVTVRQ